MCDPVTAIAVATTAVGVGSAVLGFKGQRQQANDNTAIANLQAANTYEALSQREAQIDASQSEATLSAVIEHAKAQGAISASASSYGYGGATTTRLANAASFESGRGLAIRELNAASERLQVQNDLKGSAITKLNKIAQVPQPDPLSLVLGIAKAGVQGAGSYYAAAPGGKS